MPQHSLEKQWFKEFALKDLVTPDDIIKPLRDPIGTLGTAGNVLMRAIDAYTQAGPRQVQAGAKDTPHLALQGVSPEARILKGQRRLERDRPTPPGTARPKRTTVGGFPVYDTLGIYEALGLTRKELSYAEYKTQKDDLDQAQRILDRQGSRAAINFLAEKDPWGQFMIDTASDPASYLGYGLAPRALKGASMLARAAPKIAQKTEWGVISELAKAEPALAKSAVIAQKAEDVFTKIAAAPIEQPFKLGRWAYGQTAKLPESWPKALRPAARSEEHLLSLKSDRIQLALDEPKSFIEDRDPVTGAPITEAPRWDPINPRTGELDFPDNPDVMPSAFMYAVSPKARETLTEFYPRIREGATLAYKDRRALQELVHEVSLKEGFIGPLERVRPDAEMFGSSKALLDWMAANSDPMTTQAARNITKKWIGFGSDVMNDHLLDAAGKRIIAAEAGDLFKEKRNLFRLYSAAWREQAIVSLGFHERNGLGIILMSAVRGIPPDILVRNFVSTFREMVQTGDVRAPASVREFAGKMGINRPHPSATEGGSLSAAVSDLPGAVNVLDKQGEILNPAQHRSTVDLIKDLIRQGQESTSMGRLPGGWMARSAIGALLGAGAGPVGAALGAVNAIAAPTYIAANKLFFRVIESTARLTSWQVGVTEHMDIAKDLLVKYLDEPDVWTQLPPPRPPPPGRGVTSSFRIPTAATLTQGPGTPGYPPSSLRQQGRLAQLDVEHVAKLAERDAARAARRVGDLSKAQARILEKEARQLEKDAANLESPTEAVIKQFHKDLGKSTPHADASRVRLEGEGRSPVGEVSPVSTEEFPGDPLRQLRDSGHISDAAFVKGKQYQVMYRTPRQVLDFLRSDAIRYASDEQIYVIAAAFAKDEIISTIGRALRQGTEFKVDRVQEAHLGRIKGIAERLVEKLGEPSRALPPPLTELTAPLVQSMLKIAKSKRLLTKWILEDSHLVSRVNVPPLAFAFTTPESSAALKGAMAAAGPLIPPDRADNILLLLDNVRALETPIIQGGAGGKADLIAEVVRQDGQVSAASMQTLLRLNGADADTIRRVQNFWAAQLREAQEAGYARSAEINFDYAKTDNFEEMMRYVSPFFIWPKRALPFWVDTLSEHPGWILALSRYMTLSDEDTKDLPPRFKNMVNAGTLGSWIATQAMGRPSKGYFNPVGAVLPFSGIQPSYRGDSELEKGLNVASGFGFSTFPLHQYGMNALGLMGDRAYYPTMLRFSGGIEAATGKEPEALVRNLAVGAQRAGAGLIGREASNIESFSPREYAREKRIDEMSIEVTGQARHRDYEAAKNNPSSQIYMDADRQVGEERARRFALGITSPFFIQPLTQTEERAYEGRAGMPATLRNARGRVTNAQERWQYLEGNPAARTFGTPRQSINAQQLWGKAIALGMAKTDKQRENVFSADRQGWLRTYMAWRLQRGLAGAGSRQEVQQFLAEQDAR